MWYSSVLRTGAPTRSFPNVAPRDPYNWGLCTNFVEHKTGVLEFSAFVFAIGPSTVTARRIWSGQSRDIEEL